MALFVPSQIREFLDARFPAALAELREEGSIDLMGWEAGGALSHLVSMIDGVPEHLLRLRGVEAAAFGEAVGAVRIAIDGWRSGGTAAVFLRRSPGQDSLHPLATIRRHLDELRDEGPVPPGDALLFVRDDALRESLGADLHAVEVALDSGAWKAATILGGAVVEALLLSALLDREDESRRVARTLSQQAPLELTAWSLSQLTEIAAALKILRADTAAQCRIAKDFRNLIHPGRALRLSQACDRGTALAVSAAIEFVIRDLRARG